MSNNSLSQDRVAIELGLVEPYEGYQRPRWKRTRKGGTIHHYDCKRALNALAWFWAERFETDVDLLVEIPEWLEPCKVCFDEADLKVLEVVRVIRRRFVVMHGH